MGFPSVTQLERNGDLHKRKDMHGMRRIFRTAWAQAVSLFTEEALLSVSTQDFEVNKNAVTDDVFSNEKGWSSNNWSAADED